jgi:hypothetical protein
MYNEARKTKERGQPDLTIYCILTGYKPGAFQLEKLLN